MVIVIHTIKSKTSFLKQIFDGIFHIFILNAYTNCIVGGQAVLGRQWLDPTPWFTERHGYDPTYSEQTKIGIRNIRKDIHSKINKDTELTKDNLKYYVEVGS